MTTNGAARVAYVTALLAGMVAVSGCGSARPEAHSASPAMSEPSAFPGASPSVSSSTPGANAASGAASPAAASPAATAMADSSEASESRGRVGLGTEWGETRESVVHETSFDRASWSQPFALATIRYNDRDGVESMVHGRRGHLVKTDSELLLAGGAISVALHGDEGRPFPALRLGNTSEQMNVVGRAGQRYTIVLTNHTNHRVEAVATVDGLDVMDGTTGSFDHRGYLLNPYASLEIDGFRKSESEVAAFRFGAISDSYAAQTGSARDVGVIGVALFREKGDDRDDSSGDGPTPFPGESRFAQPPPGR